MQIGDVLVSERIYIDEGSEIVTIKEHNVISKVKNGVVVETQPLSLFIAENAMVLENGVWKRLSDIIKERTQMHLESGITVHEVNQKEE